MSNSHAADDVFEVSVIHIPNDPASVQAKVCHMSSERARPHERPPDALYEASYRPWFQRTRGSNS